MLEFKKHICTVAITAALGACGGGESPDEQVANARSFVAAADYSSAVIELKNAPQQDGSYGEARLLLGTTYLKIGDQSSRPHCV